MILDPMDQGYLTKRKADLTDPKFEQDYKRMRKVFATNGRLPEAMLLWILFRQDERKEKGAKMRAGKDALETAEV
jgi:hypothetical protein